jgi:dTDP-4-dehydrorhamnose 3,5-epimerase-like enzyme
MKESTINSVIKVYFQLISDNGNLTVFPLNQAAMHMPVARIFTINRVPPNQIRGDHAHKLCTQLVVCLSGHVELELTDGNQIANYILDDSGFGILIPPGIWNKLRFQDEKTVLMVLCDKLYDPDEYIRDWNTFLKLKI